MTLMGQEMMKPVARQDGGRSFLENIPESTLQQPAANDAEDALEALAEGLDHDHFHDDRDESIKSTRKTSRDSRYRVLRF